MCTYRRCFSNWFLGDHTFPESETSNIVLGDSEHMARKPNEIFDWFITQEDHFDSEFKCLPKQWKHGCSLSSKTKQTRPTEHHLLSADKVILL